MKYQNAKAILPPELISQIQRHFQGGYLYIPQVCGRNPAQTKDTDYKIELAKRNQHIFLKHLTGWPTLRLAQHYSLSESSIRRIILRQRKDTSAMNNTIKDVLKFWGLEPSLIRQCYPTVWEIDESYMLKIYTDKAALHRNTNIQVLLRQNGIPAAEVIPTKQSEPFAVYEDQYFLLTRRLEGSSFSGPIGREIASQMGKVIAKLHIAFSNIESSLTLWHNSLLGEMNSWIRETLAKDGWCLVSKQDFDQIYEKLSLCYSQLPVQMIHRDVHTGNFLFFQGEFSGYIDFDLSQRNIRIFDLCYFLAGLLAEETAADLSASWPEIVRAAVAGYEELLPLSATERKAIPLVMESIEILFAAYFTGIEDNVCANDAVRVLRCIQKQEAKLNL